MAETGTIYKDGLQTNTSDSKAFEEDDLQRGIAEFNVLFEEDDWQLDMTFMDCASHLYMNKHLSDVTFLLTNETPAQRVPAHKFILAMRSPVFEAMFYGPIKEMKREIIIAETPVNGFLLMLRFLYADWIELSPEDAMECIQVAHMYRVPMLIKHCEYVLKQSRDVSSVCTILEIAMFFNLTDLKEMCVPFIESNAMAVLKDPDFLSAPRDVVQLIVENAQLRAEELEIYQAVDNWATHQCLIGTVKSSHKNKRKYLGDAFLQLRLEDIPLNEFITGIVKESLLSEHEKLAVYNYHNKVIPHLEFVTNDKRCKKSETITADEHGTLSNHHCWILHDCITECLVSDMKFHKNTTLRGVQMKNTDVVGRSVYTRTPLQRFKLYDRISCKETWHTIESSVLNDDSTKLTWEGRPISVIANHEYQLSMFVCSFRKTAQKVSREKAVSSTTALDSNTSVFANCNALSVYQYLTRPLPGSHFIQNVIYI